MKRELTNLERFLTTDYEGQFQLLKEPKIKAEVQRWMGAAAFDQLSQQGPGSHLGSGAKNIVFVPGVMGSTLQSEGLGGVWWLDMARARDKLNQLKLSADGKGDLDQDAEIKPGAVDLSYVPFRKAIATSKHFGGSVQFAYDWRKSLRSSADILLETILRTYKDYESQVHLVGHSMGGLMIRIALMIHGDKLWPKVNKIVFIGTPHYGSPSIAGYLKNHLWGWEEIAIVGMFLSRETFRTMRGVLSLLPAPPGIYPGTHNGGQHPCANFDMYDAEAWSLNLNAADTVHLQEVLAEARQFHTDLHQWHNSLLQVHKDKMLMIAGVGQEALFRLEFDDKFWGAWKHTKKITQRIPCAPDRDGDGRVPLASAQLEDVATVYVKGEHGSLPNIPAVAGDVIAWLTEDDLKLSKTCPGALGGHLSAEEAAPPTPLLDGFTSGSRFRELLDYENPTPQFRKEIEEALDLGEMPQVNRVKIL